MKHKIRIGEHTSEIRCQSESLMRWIDSHFQNEDTYDATNIVDFILDVKEGYGTSFVDYHVEINTDPNHITYDRKDYLITVSRDYRKAIIEVYDELALKHALTNFYSAFIVHNNWGLLIHSSCIDHDKRAYVFAGQSGAGKSTISRLSYPRPILSDEATLIKISNGGIRVFDSPFRSEITIPYTNQTCELTKILLLNQSKEIKVSLVNKSNALIHILDKVFFWHHDNLETAKVLRMCLQLVNQIPIYNLYFQENNKFWELIS